MTLKHTKLINCESVKTCNLFLLCSVYCNETFKQYIGAAQSYFVDTLIFISIRDHNNDKV